MYNLQKLLIPALADLLAIAGARHGPADAMRFGLPEHRADNFRLATTPCMIGDRVWFDIGSAELRPDATYTITRFVKLFMAYPAEVELQGHTDAHHPDENSENLGLRRAKATRDAFIALGFPAERIRVVGYGDQRPAVLGENTAAWTQNRRVEFVVRRILGEWPPPEAYC